MPVDAQDATFRHFADYFCVFCGAQALWSGADDWEPGDGIEELNFVQCVNCGRDYQVINAADEAPEVEPTSIVAQIRAAIAKGGS
jgi:hypothetical protein